eukprot:5455436-Pyramimonas_sp.AAC.1
MGAWAVVTVAKDERGLSLQGILWGEVQHANAMGILPSGGTSTTADCLAIIWCLFWLVQVQPRCAITTRTDSLLALGAAQGRSRPACDY